MKLNKRSPLSAFTLLEIMLVVAIIALMMGAGFMFLGPQFQVAQDAKMRSDFQSLGQTLQLYENLNGFLPTTQQGLEALVTLPSSEPKPTHWYQLMKQLPKDPWQNDYVYVCPGKHDPNGYDIYSKGKDRIADTPDDKGNWDLK